MLLAALQQAHEEGVAIMGGGEDRGAEFADGAAEWIGWRDDSKFRMR